MSDDPVLHAVQQFMDAVEARIGTQDVTVRAFIATQDELIRALRDELLTRAAPASAEPPKDGKDGRGIAAAFIRAADLILTMTDGSETNVGRVVGENGTTPTVPTPEEFRAMIRKEIPEPVAGKDGIGVASARMQNDSLVLRLTDGTEHDVGRVVGKDKEAPKVPSPDEFRAMIREAIPEPIEGKSGIGIAEISKRDGDMIVRLTDNTERNLGRIEPTDGADGIASREELESIVEARFADLQVRTIADLHQRTYVKGTQYKKSAVVAWSRSTWIAMVDTDAVPGTSPDWQMIAGNGRDGRDAVRAPREPYAR